MRIILFSLGSRGDIQPILALASRLNREGHTAVVSSSPDFAELAASHGIEYAPIGPSLTTIGDAEEISKIVESGNILKLILYGRKIRNMQSNIVQQCIQESWQVAQGADAILYKPSAAIIGYNIAEKLGIPCAELALFPVYRTRVFPSFMLGGGKNRGPLLNDLFWRLSELLFWQLMQRGTANRQRREILDLPPLPLSGPYQQQEREGMPVFNAYSPSVLPRPADWPARMHVTGYYFSAPPTDWQPPAELVEFLRSGPPPVCIGFGSMPIHNVEEKIRMVVKALMLSGQRGILISGWTTIKKSISLPDDVIRVESIPHSWLFPRMAAVVHHGGAGTTAASLRSGVPTIITPFAADQPAWGQRVYTLGVGPKPIPFKKLTAEGLAAAIREAVTNPEIQKRARELGQRIQAEDGPGRTIELFFQYIEQFRRLK